MAILLAATAAVAADWDVRYDQTDLYRAEEMSFDVFGTASLGKSSIEDLSGETIDEDTEWGLGIGANYFFMRSLGVGADAYSDDTSGSFVDSASLNLIGRFPLGESGFAPSVFGGGGRQFDGDEWWFLQLGGGIEYRFNRSTGVFLDGRVVWPEETDYYGVLRLGLRFAF
jgi:hypothetical protein